MKSQSVYIEEVNTLVNQLDIAATDAMEIINIYFECFADSWVYEDYLRDQIRIIRDTDENQDLIAELKEEDDACLFEGDDYYMLTNYQTAVNMGIIRDCIPDHSF